MSTETGERSLTVDEVIDKLCDLTARASKKFGHDHRGVRIMRQARDALTQLRSERDHGYNLLADAIDLIEDLKAEIERPGKRRI